MREHYNQTKEAVKRLKASGLKRNEFKVHAVYKRKEVVGISIVLLIPGTKELARKLFANGAYVTVIKFIPTGYSDIKYNITVHDFISPCLVTRDLTKAQF